MIITTHLATLELMRIYYILLKNSVGHLLRISWYYFCPPPPPPKFYFFPLQLNVGERAVQKAVSPPPPSPFHQEMIDAI